MKLQIVMANFNEWHPDWDSYCGPLASFKGDLRETTQLLYSNDDWRLCPPVEKFKIVEVALPSWLVQGFWERYINDGCPDVEEAYQVALSSAAKAVYGHDLQIYGALRWLSKQNGGKFASSLRDQWADLGTLTEKQIDSCRTKRGYEWAK